jgi:hypothetical protein
MSAMNEASSNPTPEMDDDSAASTSIRKSDMIDSCQEKKDICRPFNREKKRTFYDYPSRALVEAGSF